jgi:hypothetical protein
MLHSINHEQRLYVLSAGDGFSCLGFDVALQWAKGVATWLREYGEVCAAPNADLRGTAEGFQQHQAIMDAGRKFNLQTGHRCNLLLTPELIGLERRRVEVVDQHDEKRRFWIGKSTGWLPVHLEIARPSSTHGPAVMGAPFKSVQVVR